MNALTLTQPSSLTDLDWQVVEIARADGPRSLNPDGWVNKFLQDFFGIPPARKLANEKLEALRRFCVRAWYWDLVRSKEIRMLVEAGYSSIDVFRILAHVAGYRGFTPAIEEQPI